MSFIVPPGGEFGDITDLATYGRMRGRRLPAEVAEQLHVAAQLADELQAAGVELRFREPGEPGQRVRAMLTDDQGNDLCEVSLAQVVALELPI
jgi:hypothetical protein